ncbi:hypothetical protein MSG28_010937 [Choristoneura fumiferana]|uniref:Uncharacterized protein n=1 Tax=Choristoneura fumiferana TaxID=7141 RepID=A0ACC0KQ44_CHOFU|nr:hypothetical protein MSG28_010937 [Choristoneura fumiferana]
MISVITVCLSICLVYLYFAFVMDLKDDDRLSDDEVFYGKLSLKEIKRMFISNQNHRQTFAASEHKETDGDDNNKSLQLISTHSEPDITSKHTYIKSPETDVKALSYTTLSPDEPNIFATWDVTSSNNSFLKYEKLVEEACDSKKDFDNTLEEIEYILANTPGKSDIKTELCVGGSKQETDEIGFKTIPKIEVNNVEQSFFNAASTAFTPVKQEKNVTEVFATPSSELVTKTPSLKTPANPPLFKKPSTSSLKKTPSKNNAFKHIASPVAYYIKNTPQAPLIQNVYPKKPLIGSSIPKLVKPTVVKPSNKENVNLPPVAYKSAKKTTVIDVPTGPKMPQSPWAKKLTKSFPKPTVMKHIHREKELLNNRSLQRRQEDSFGDLSLHQADISVCTKKAAF